MTIFILKAIFLFIVLLICIYTVRHYIFTLNRLFGRQRHPYIDIDTADWPSVTVVVPAHNEEAVISESLEALLASSYPSERMQIIVANDRSEDATGSIVETFVARFPNRIIHFDRREGKPGKASALKDVMEFATGDIVIVFDADYIPGRGLMKQLVAPFFDPEIGLVMGRVVPINTGYNLLTRLLDLERSGGYQADQQARMNLGLVPQYGGTVGGVRRVTLEAVGGWHDTLAEDTDLTYRALLKGWKTAYQNRSECYEEVPQVWPVRIRQIMRWARGHNEALFRYAFAMMGNKRIPFREKIDGFLLLGVYMMSPIVVLGWLLGLLLFYLGETHLSSGWLMLLAITSFGTVGNFAAFFEVASAVKLDRGKQRIKLLPFNFLNFVTSIISVTRATSYLPHDLGKGEKHLWDKTPRYRNGNGHYHKESV